MSRAPPIGAALKAPHWVAAKNLVRSVTAHLGTFNGAGAESAHQVITGPQSACGA